MHIGSMEQLQALAADGVVILVQRDVKVKMASVFVAGRPFMDGNSWDFKPECHGGFHYELAELHGSWLSSRGLAEAIQRCLEANGATNITIVNEEYDWIALMRKWQEREKASA